MNANSRNSIVLWLITGLLWGPAAVLSARQGPNPERDQARYQIILRATRTADHTLILAASAPLVLGRVNVVRTKSIDSAENAPSLPSFTATLSQADPTGRHELVTRVWVRESLRNKKGRLKVNNRNIGSLLPIRLGETQTASAVGDSITLEWRVERL